MKMVMSSGRNDVEGGHRINNGVEPKRMCSLGSSVEGAGGKSPFGEVRDRPLSNLIGFRDFRVQDKVFESVRKFGRPRQQISDILKFEEFAEDEKKHKAYKESYHFGQCLVLPKISTLPSKGNINISKRQEKPRYSAPLPGLECNVSASKHKRYNESLQLISTIENCEFENKMYRWNDMLSETHDKPAADEKQNMTVRSRTNIYRDYEKYYTYELDDVEAQVNTRWKETGKSNTLQHNDNYYYRSSTMESQGRRPRNAEGVMNTTANDLKDNWGMRVSRESEPHRSRPPSREEKDKYFQKVKSFSRQEKDEEVWERPVEPRYKRDKEEERGKKELHRSKSTPDMVEGVGNGKLKVWTLEKRNGSMMEVCTRSWSVYNDQQEADSLNEGNSLEDAVSSPEPPGGVNQKASSGKNFLGQIFTPNNSQMFTNTEPFSQFWVVLSNIYGQALVILILAFSLTEAMDNSVKLLSLQGIFLMYLYVGSIAVIICIYIWVLIDSCSSISSNDSSGLVPPTITTSIVHDREAELQNFSSTKFGSLKKAHISRDRTSSTSFYLRIGAIAFGLGTLVFNGLEMAMHSMMESSCLNDVVFVHPILHGLFTFLQMHFLFVNSQVLVERFGLAARFGFMHLAATNLALWIRLVVWESGNEWTHFVHLSQNEAGLGPTDIPSPLQLRGFPKFILRQQREIDYGTSENNLYRAISSDHISQVVSLHKCLNSNSLGQLWTSSMPFLYPFIIQFSLIAAAVTYIMGQNVAKDRLFFQKQKKTGSSDSKNCTLPALHDNINAWNVDCSGASKGLFLGILCLVTGVVVIIIFLVVKENDNFPQETIFWLTSGTLITILSMTIVVNVIGLIQIRKLSVIGTKMTPLDRILSVISILGVQLYTILGMVVGASGVAQEYDSDLNTSSMQKRHGMLLAVSLIQLMQAIMQSSFIVEGIRRTTLSRTQALTMPSRQVVTFLMFSNAVLWAFDTFVIQSWMSQELQLRFFGVLAWGVISRIGLPLFVFFRFHSCVLLLEIWKKSYQSLHLDPGN